MPLKPALDAVIDQAFATAADGRHDVPAFVFADAGEFAAKLAELFPGDETTAARAVMAAVMMLAGLAGLLARYADFPGGLELVPSVLGLAAEQLAREAGAS